MENSTLNQAKSTSSLTINKWGDIKKDTNYDIYQDVKNGITNGKTLSTDIVFMLLKLYYKKNLTAYCWYNSNKNELHGCSKNSSILHKLTKVHLAKIDSYHQIRRRFRCRISLTSAGKEFVQHFFLNSHPFKIKKLLTFYNTWYVIKIILSLIAIYPICIEPFYWWWKCCLFGNGIISAIACMFVSSFLICVFLVYLANLVNMWLKWTPPLEDNYGHFLAFSHDHYFIYLRYLSSTATRKNVIKFFKSHHIKNAFHEYDYTYYGMYTNPNNDGGAMSYLNQNARQNTIKHIRRLLK